MKKVYLKSTCLFLLLTMLVFPALVSCKKGGQGESDSTSESTNSTQDTSENSYLDSLPKRDYNNDIFSILCTTQTSEFYIDGEDYSSTIVGQGVHTRNEAVQDMYNIEIEYSALDGNSSGAAAFSEKVRTDILSGEGEFDLILGQSYYCMPLALENHYSNIANSPYIKLDNPWYHNMINDNGTIDGKLFAASGTFIMAQIANATCIFFNKQMAQANGFTESLYDMVENKKWTLEVLNEMAMSVGSDLDSNDIYDEKDSYGLVGGRHTVSGLITGCDCPVTMKKSDGSISVVVYNSHSVDVVDRLHDILIKNDKMYLKDNDLDTLNIFLDNRSLFCSVFINAMTFETTKNMENPYGVLPQPLFNEQQSSYQTFTNRWELFYIPKFENNAERAERAEIITEVLNYYSYMELLPKYYETSLQNRLSDTENDSKMLNIIVDTLTYDFSSFFDAELGMLSTFLTRCVNSGNVASAWKGNGAKFERLLDALFTKYQTLG